MEDILWYSKCCRDLGRFARVATNVSEFENESMMWHMYYINIWRVYCTTEDGISRQEEKRSSSLSSLLLP